jgi:2-hydroxychromene-2-carboxylate isomerase
VHFWFDAGCPFTWATSCWLRDVAATRGAEVEWHLMSLPILNEGRAVPEQYRDAMARSWRTARVLAAAGEVGGSPAVGSLYRALGERVHEQGRPADDDVLSEALEAAGLSGRLVDAADDPAYDQAVRASHEQSQQRVGMDSGSPITALDDGPAYFGPVVAPVPGGASATRLWEALVSISQVPELSELKRGRAAL